MNIAHFRDACIVVKVSFLAANRKKYTRFVGLWAKKCRFCDKIAEKFVGTKKKIYICFTNH